MATKGQVEFLVLSEEAAALGLDELASLCGLDREMVEELAEAGCFTAAALPGSERRFDARSAAIVRRARRLGSDFELDAAGVALAVSLLARIEALETRLRELECQLRR
jgi:chaperone modulatory protein CbpM